MPERFMPTISVIHWPVVSVGPHFVEPRCQLRTISVGTVAIQDFNTCAEGGGIVGVDGDYPRLQIGADGSAGATATVPQPLSTGAAYHVNVHLSEAEMDVIIACGDLVI
jgi:hypothetical protein